jgi:hypothetical protein
MQRREVTFEVYQRFRVPGRYGRAFKVLFAQARAYTLTHSLLATTAHIGPLPPIWFLPKVLSRLFYLSSSSLSSDSDLTQYIPAIASWVYQSFFFHQGVLQHTLLTTLFSPILAIYPKHASLLLLISSIMSCYSQYSINFFPSFLHTSSLKCSLSDTKNSHFLLFEHPCFWSKHYYWFDYRAVDLDSGLSWYWFWSQERVEHAT